MPSSDISAPGTSPAPLSLVESVRALGGGSEYTPAERQGALTRLVSAPPEGVWNDALAGALSHPDEDVRLTAVGACMARLHRLARTEDQSAFLETLLRRCFLDCAPETQPARAGLLRQLVHFCEQRPLELDYFRGRLLSRARQVPYALRRQRELAGAVVESQRRMAAETGRSDSEVARQLDLERRFLLFHTAGADEAILLAYIRHDRDLSPKALTPEWFSAYLSLLRVHGHAEPVLVEALHTLAHWLDGLPQERDARCAMVGETLRARRGVPWEELDPRIRVHLVAHTVLLPGPEHPGDLLQMLRAHYTHPGAEMILGLGFEVLGRLPGLRARLPELCEFLEGEGMRRLGPDAWAPAMDAVGRLANGLREEEVSREGLEAQSLQRLLRRKQLLAVDQQVRDTLVRISRREDYARDVRIAARRALLRLLPPDRMEYYAEDLAETEGIFFLSSLAEAGRTRQRQAWSLASHAWEGLRAAAGSAAKRRERLLAVCDVLRRFRSYDVVGRQGANVPPLIHLALDDSDPVVRDRALRTVHEAGYTAELEREQQRRHLEDRRAHLEAVGQTLTRLDTRMEQLVAESHTTRARRAALALEVQAIFHERDRITTEGWSVTASMMIDLAEVRELLLEAMATAAVQTELLRDLQRQLQAQLRETQGTHGAVQTLVGQQEDAEARAGWLRSRIQQEGARLQAQGLLDSPELAQCRGELQAVNGQLSHLTAEVRRALQRTAELDRRLRDLTTQFQAGQAARDRARREIARLSERADALQNELMRLRREHRAALEATQRALDACLRNTGEVVRRLAHLSTQITATRDEIERERTRHQALTQEIELGRRYYEQLGARAAQESAEADALGESERQAAEALILEDQESALWYGYDLQGALEQQALRVGTTPVGTSVSPTALP